MRDPRRTVVALVSDFEEGGSVSQLVSAVGRLHASGVRLLGLAALDERDQGPRARPPPLDDLLPHGGELRTHLHRERQIVEAGKRLNISVHDHIIIGLHGHSSMRAKGLL